MHTLWLIRHGRTVAAGERRFVGRTDLPMSPDGEAEIERVRRLLAEEPIDRIVCSDLARSRRTAAILAAGRDVPIEIEPGLREIDMGRWEGRDRAELAESEPEAWRARGADFEHFRPPGGESFADLAARAGAVADRLLADPALGTVVIAAHAGVDRVLLAGWLGIPFAGLFRLAQPFGAVARLAFSASGPRLDFFAAPADVERCARALAPRTQDR